MEINIQGPLAAGPVVLLSTLDRIPAAAEFFTPDSKRHATPALSARAGQRLSAQYSSGGHGTIYSFILVWVQLLIASLKVREEKIFTDGNINNTFCSNCLRN